MPRPRNLDGYWSGRPHPAVTIQQPCHDPRTDRSLFGNLLTYGGSLHEKWLVFDVTDLHYTAYNEGTLQTLDTYICTYIIRK